MSDPTEMRATADEVERASRPWVQQPHLFVAFQCDRPLAYPSGHVLDQLDEVAIGRSRGRSSVHRKEGEKRSLEITIPDPWMSTRHARLNPVLGRWVLEDEGSRNGTFVNGKPCKRTLLNDGDVFELGHTLFLFRDAIRADEDHPDLDASECESSAAGLATLSAGLTAEFSRMRLIARSRVPVVVAGESGTGKELVARAIHLFSERRGELVPVNCGAIPPTLVESELFGYRRGAFTGASEERRGLMRAADGGTLFLDEIADLPAPGQAALLRALQESEVLPVGGTKAVKIDARVVAATHFDLKTLVRRGTFRGDLYARLSGFAIKLPPLRNRLHDLGIVVADILRKAAPDRCDRVSFRPDAARAMLRYPWPLNIRELEKALTAALALAQEHVIGLEHLPEEVRESLAEAPGPSEAESEPPVRLRLSNEDASRRDELIARMREHRGNISAVARSMGKARVQIQRWVHRFGLAREDFRAGAVSLQRPLPLGEDRLQRDPSEAEEADQQSERNQDQQSGGLEIVSGRDQDD
jgi:sigma-54 dependent transcriptional regulator, acetoin dehydrogenase operon transcriptional activator AcoR